MSLEASVANIVIRDNKFDQGRVSDTATVTTYKYTYHAWLYGSANVQGNTFLAPSTSSDILNIDSCSCFITNNKFIRDAVSINSYIRVYGSNEQTVVNNIFDSPTVNGSSETLVLNISSTSVYERNKNQTKNIAILPNSGEYRSWTAPRLYTSSSYYGSQICTDGSGSGGLRYMMQASIVSDTNNPGPQRFIEFFINLSNFLPKGVKVLDHLVGMKFGTVGTNLNTSTTSTMSVRMHTTVAANPINASFASPASTYALLQGTDVSGTATLENTVTTSTSITSGNYNTTTVWYNTANYNANSFINQESVNIIATLKYSFSTTVTASTSSTLWSPLLIKYRWI